MNKQNKEGKKVGYWEHRVDDYFWKGSYDFGYEEGVWKYYVGGRLYLYRSYDLGNETWRVDVLTWGLVYGGTYDTIHQEDYE